MAINIVCGGSSTTAALSSYIRQYSGAGVTVNNVSQGGYGAAQIVATEPTVDAFRVAGDINVYWCQPSSNDFPSTDFAWLRPHLLGRKAVGFHIVLVNQLPRANDGYNIWRNDSLNPELDDILTEGIADYLMDWGRDPVIGTDAAGDDLDIIDADGVHPTQFTQDYGHDNYVVPIMAGIVRPRYVLSW
jgi:hypothetical protein